MKKYQKIIILTTACFLFTTPAEAAQQAEKAEITVSGIVGAQSLKDGMSTVTDPEHTAESLAGIDLSKGVYLLDEKGNIYYRDSDGKFFQNGSAPDKCLYDEHGVQINTLNYIRDKYYDTFVSLDPAAQITFDNENEENLFLQYYQLEYASEQGKEIFYSNAGGGKISVRKSDITNMKSDKGSAYTDKVAEIAGSLAGCQTTEEKIMKAAEQASEAFTYDANYLLKDINQAVRDKRGICYHYTKLLHDVLKEAGIQSEYMVGHLKKSEGMHAWLKVYNEEEEKWVYVDPTSMNQDMAAAMFRYDIPAAYLDAYSQAEIS